MMAYLSLKNEDKFLKILDNKKIKYRQGEILSCFKKKDRDADERILIKKVSPFGHLSRSKSTLIRYDKYRLNP